MAIKQKTEMMGFKNIALMLKMYLTALLVKLKILSTLLNAYLNVHICTCDFVLQLEKSMFKIENRVK